MRIHRLSALVAAAILASGCELSDAPPGDFVAKVYEDAFPYVRLDWTGVRPTASIPVGTTIQYRIERRFAGEIGWTFVADVTDTNPANPESPETAYMNLRRDEADRSTDSMGRVPEYNRLPEDTAVEYRIHAFHPSYGTSRTAYASTRTGINHAYPATGVASLGSIDLAWTDNSRIEEGYEIYRATAASDGTFHHVHGAEGPRWELFDLVATTGPNVTSYTDTTVESGERYLYLVVTYSDARGLEHFTYAGDTAWGIFVP